MKRLFAFLLCFILALPALTGCGVAQGDAAPQDNVPAEATPAEITPTALPPTPAATAVPTLAQAQSTAVEYGSWEELLASLYTAVGRFYFKPEELEDFRALPQDEEYSFVVHRQPGAKGDARMTEYNEMSALAFADSKLYDDCMANGGHVGDNGVDPDDYPWAKDSYAATALEKLPREWFENEQRVRDYFNTVDTNALVNSLYNEYELKSCAEFAAAGCACEVRAYTEVDGGAEVTHYICIVTVTPARLWELSADESGEMYRIEPLYPAVEGRFSQLICTGEELIK